MNNFLPYLIKSTICISLLYLLFRTVMRKESFFALNRMVLLSIVVISAVIPLLYLPGAIQSPVQVELLPVFAPAAVQPEAIPASSLDNSTFVEQSVAQASIPGNSNQKLAFSKQQLLQYLYLAGFLFTLMFLLRGLFTLFSLFRKVKAVQMDGYRLLVIEKEIAAFSFGGYVILSQRDYEEHRQTLLAHEQAHIRLHHFFDLLLLETVRIFHWFNPVIYWLIKDLKEIHEFQADDYTLTNGIDATQYQLLIIQKGVGSERFALANSFNHCQIKKRITMMNKSKTSKTGSWKVATFLPLLALLLMAFGKQSENVVDTKEVANQVNNENNEIQSLQKGISQEQLLEYENIVNKLRNHKGVPDIGKITDADRNRLEELFLSMNAEQRKSQTVVFNPRTPPLPKSAPTIEQMKNWEDPKIYGVWINDKRVSNLDLKNYANSDFAMVFVSKLAKNAINYGKHYYQVHLMTTEYYANYLKQHELTSKYWIMVRKRNEISKPLVKMEM